LDEFEHLVLPVGQIQLQILNEQTVKICS